MMQQRVWKFVYDPKFISLKNRKKMGLETLETPADEEQAGDLEDLDYDGDPKLTQIVEVMRMA